MKASAFQDTAVIFSAAPLLPHEATGWADGDDVFKIAKLADAATFKVGAKGNMAVSINADQSAEITMKFFSNSPTNKYLNDVLNLQRNTRTWAPIGVTFQDLVRLDSAVAITGFIKKLPDITRGGGITNQEWTIVVPDIYIVLANPSFAGFNQAFAEAMG